MSHSVSVVVLAAGLGTRMASGLRRFCTRWGACRWWGMWRVRWGSRGGRVVAVVGPGMEAVVEAVRAGLPGVSVAGAEQVERKGTGHAVLMARAALAGSGGLWWWFTATRR